MENMTQKKALSSLFEFCRFVIVGLIATSINLITYYSLIKIVNMNSSLAFSIGYGTSLLFNYFLTINFTFKTTHDNTKGAQFLFTHIFNYLLQLFLLNVLILMGHNDSAPILAQAISVPINFLLIRNIVK